MVAAPLDTQIPISERNPTANYREGLKKYSPPLVEAVKAGLERAARTDTIADAGSHLDYRHDTRSESGL